MWGAARHRTGERQARRLGEWDKVSFLIRWAKAREEKNFEPKGSKRRAKRIVFLAAGESLAFAFGRLFGTSVLNTSFLFFIFPEPGKTLALSGLQKRSLSRTAPSDKRRFGWLIGLLKIGKWFLVPAMLYLFQSRVWLTSLVSHMTVKSSDIRIC